MAHPDILKHNTTSDNNNSPAMKRSYTDKETLDDNNVEGVILSMPDWDIDEANTDLLDLIETDLPPSPLLPLSPSPTTLEEDLLLIDDSD